MIDPSTSPSERTPVVVNRDILAMEYAVRGAIPARAAAMAAAGRHVIWCNIGNPQALGQRPITWYRQVLSVAEDHARLARERTWAAQPSPAPDFFALPDDVLDTAAHFLDAIGTGMGAYTDSTGPRFIREAIAAFIDARDNVTPEHGLPADPDQIFLTNGASEGAKYLLEMLIDDPADGILIPVPQYPLYSASIRKAGGAQVDYVLDEEGGWTVSRTLLDKAMADAARRGVRVKAMVVINPGNPTGGVMDEETIETVIAFAAEHELILIADEVYQENTYGAPFQSFAKVLGRRAVPLASLHSTSKGFIGECGHRGGYLEMRNPPLVAGSDTGFSDVLRKLASVSLCPNTGGQLLTWLMVSPPAEGAPSHAGFVAERTHILDELHDKAIRIRDALHEMEGVRCFGRTGAMYLFPRLDTLPEGTSDFDYCMRLLEETGLCTVNGAGFGQAAGTQHLRIAFLPPKEMLDEVLPEWVRFHNDYVGAR